MATVYVYSDFATKAIRESHLSVCSSVHSAIKSHLVIGGLICIFGMCLLLYISFCAGVKYAQTNSTNDDVKRTHRIDINVTSDAHSEDKQHNLTLSRCLRTVEAINDTVSRIPVKLSQAYVHQLRYDVQEKIDSFYGKNESLTPHHRRRPPVEAWNDEDDY